MTDSVAHSLGSIKNIVENYQRSFPLESKQKQIVNIVENYQKSNLFKTYQIKKKNRLPTIKKLLKNYKKTSISIKSQKYDLFSEMKIKLSENELSNIIADMLNPIKSPFGKAILLRLLQEKKKDLLVRILNSTNIENIIVKREQTGDSSRIDIRIYTDLPDNNIIIDVEMKVGCGCETTHNSGKPQTVREWNDLNTFAKSKNIPSQNIAAYFITPHGIIAKSDYFISLSMYQLNEIILEELKTSKKSQLIDKDGISACRHFFASRWLF